jgi:hypothetical protein
VVPSPWNRDRQEKDARKQQDSAKPVQPTPTTIRAENSTGKQEQKADPKPSGYPWGELLAPANVPNWFLVGAACLAGWLAYKTLRAIKEQADIMKTQATDARESGAQTFSILKEQTDNLLISANAATVSAMAADESAKAANAQIQMMKDKERARVAVEITPIETLDTAITGTNRIVLKFRNLGPTRAFNVTSEGDARAIIPDQEPLPFEFTDLVLPTVLEPTPSPSESWVAVIFPEEWLDDLLLRPRIRIEVRGITQYDDVFGDHHFTKFGYDMRIPKLVGKWEGTIAKIHPFSRWCQSKEPNSNEAT